MTLVDIVALVVLRRLHRGTLTGFDFGTGKIEQLVGIAIALSLLAGAVWVGDGCGAHGVARPQPRHTAGLQPRRGERRHQLLRQRRRLGECAAGHAWPAVGDHARPTPRAHDQAAVVGHGADHHDHRGLRRGSGHRGRRRFARRAAGVRRHGARCVGADRTGGAGAARSVDRSYRRAGAERAADGAARRLPAARLPLARLGSRIRVGGRIGLRTRHRHRGRPARRALLGGPSRGSAAGDATFSGRAGGADKSPSPREDFGEP